MKNESLGCHFGIVTKHSIGKSASKWFCDFRKMV